MSDSREEQCPDERLRAVAEAAENLHDKTPDSFFDNEGFEPALQSLLTLTRPLLPKDNPGYEPSLVRVPEGEREKCPVCRGALGACGCLNAPGPGVPDKEDRDAMADHEATLAELLNTGEGAPPALGVADADLEALAQVVTARRRITSEMEASRELAQTSSDAMRRQLDKERAESYEWCLSLLPDPTATSQPEAERRPSPEPGSVPPERLAHFADRVALAIEHGDENGWQVARSELEGIELSLRPSVPPTTLDDRDDLVARIEQMAEQFEYYGQICDGLVSGTWQIAASYVRSALKDVANGKKDGE